MLPRILLLCLAMWMSSASAVASAAGLRVDFTGHVDSVLGQDPNATLGGSIHVGTLFTGSLTFDPEEPGLPDCGP